MIFINTPSLPVKTTSLHPPKHLYQFLATGCVNIALFTQKCEVPELARSRLLLPLAAYPKAAAHVMRPGANPTPPQFPWMPLSIPCGQRLIFHPGQALPTLPNPCTMLPPATPEKMAPEELPGAGHGASSRLASARVARISASKVGKSFLGNLTEALQIKFSPSIQ